MALELTDSNFQKTVLDSDKLSMLILGSIPTILFIKGGKVVDKQVGAVPKNVLEAKIKAHLQAYFGAKKNPLTKW